MKIASIIAVVLAILVGSCAIGRAKDRQFAEQIPKIKIGMTSSQVRAILGDPSWEGRCGSYIGYGWKENCSAELGYSSAFAPILPSYDMIQLDKNGRVIASDPISSP